MKKYFIFVFLAAFFLLFKIGDFFSPSVSAGDTVYCTYTYGEWGICDNYGIRTRSYTPSPTGCCPVDPPVFKEICPGTNPSSTTICTYIYGDWNTCSSNGCQYRSYTLYPPDCHFLNSPIIYQACTYESINVPCTYSYGSWSACSPDGYQTRDYYATPYGCYQATMPITTQSCTYTPTSTTYCLYDYGEWGICDATTGYQTRSYTIYPSGCLQLDAPFIRQACTSTETTTTPCAYTYSAWSTCNSSGYQTRTVLTKYPTGCSTIEQPLTSQSCSLYVTSTIPCSFTYGEWGPCNTSGYQIRNYDATPAGCYQAYTPIIYQSCTSTETTTTPCAYTYSAWSACSTTGIKTRSYTAFPSGCYQTTAPLLHQKCTSTDIAPIPCSFTYGEWGECNKYNYQTRTVLTKHPTGCVIKESPVIKRECTYFPPTIAAVPTTSAPEIPVCRFEYSAWSDCISDQQTRMVIAKTPSECRVSIAPVLHQACKSAPVIEAIPSPDIPVPVPQVVLVPETVVQINFNGKTSNEWQKYYFGAEECKTQDICSGQADPDRDGLNNNEEYRYGTNPKKSDSDHDGYVDADEIQRGRNPLVVLSEKTDDKMAFESPKEKGEVRQDLYEVKKVEMVKAEKDKKNLKITGKALPNIYVTIYIYSEPIILTVKTDSEGNWSYVLENPLEEGDHEVYVAVTDNAGKIVAKSEPVAFVQTAEAAIISNLPPIGAPDKNEASPTKAWFKGNYSIFIILGILGLMIALSAIGLIRSSKKPEDPLS